MMWVAQVTEARDDKLHNERFQMLTEMFPQYDFSILLGSRECIIAKPVDETIQAPGDEGTERGIMLFILTELLDIVMSPTVQDAIQAEESL